MALSVGDVVVPAGVVNGSGKVADLSVGSLCPEGLNMGTYLDEPNTFAIWANGETSTPDTSTSNMRKVSAYGGPPLLGKTVTLPNKSPAFVGVVVQELGLELDNTGGNGSASQVVLVRASGFFYLAIAGDVEEV